MKTNKELLSKNQDMTQKMPDVVTPKWNPRTRQWDFPKDKKDIVKSEYDF